jgi:hypothetical protein
MTITNRAAAALDMTHAAASRNIGIHTETARKVLAAYLDGAVKIKASTVAAYCKYLEMVGRA